MSLHNPVGHTGHPGSARLACQASHPLLPAIPVSPTLLTCLYLAAGRGAVEERRKVF